MKHYFNRLCAQDEAQKKAFEIIRNVKESDVDSVYKEQKNVKKGSSRSELPFSLVSEQTANKKYKESYIERVITKII